MVRAHRRTLDLTFSEEIEAVQLDFLAEWNHTDDGRGAAGRQHRESLLGGLLAAQNFKRVMHATMGEVAHLLHHVTVAGVDDVSGAQFGRELEFGRVGGDRNAAASTRGWLAGARGQAEPATAV